MNLRSSIAADQNALDVRRTGGVNRHRRHRLRRRLLRYRFRPSRARRFAIASSGGSKSAKYRRPPLPMPSLRSSSFSLVRNGRWASDCALQKGSAWVNIRRQMWRSRSLIIQAKCGTFAATGSFMSCPGSMRKVTP